MSDKMELRNLFSTQVASKKFSNTGELNKSLQKQIEERMIHDKGIQRSNLSNTWHSGYDCMEWLEGYGDVKSMVTQMAAKFATLFGHDPKQPLGIHVASWVMYTPPTGAYATYHTHPNCHFSSVYYVNPGKPYKGHLKSGQIEFFDARNWGHLVLPRPMSFSYQATFEPVAGELHMFRAEAPHMVHPYFGKGPRIAIANNITLIDPKKK
jgi:uncharacterized protein (TIGR02466 family)